jgi:MoaA/NifB/PqqE/SkfB family radical SAM enzyme
MERNYLLNKIANLDDDERRRLLSHQGVAGYFEYFYQDLINTGHENFKSQQRRNIIYEQEAVRLHELFKSENKDLVFLKGITFLEDLYPELGTRFMSDIDCYYKSMDLEWLKTFMGKNSYRYLDTPKGKGNAHKCEFVKKTPFGDVNFEFHNKLFWHREDPGNITIKKMRFNRLGHEENFVYLCGHYAFLHSCQKLYWLWDIYLFLLKYQQDLDMVKVHNLARYFGFEKSIHFTLRLISKAFGLKVNWPGKKSKLYINDQVFFNDDQRSLYYIYIKTFLKDSKLDSLSYVLGYFAKNDS